MASVRRFRLADEVEGKVPQEDDRRFGRTWEEEEDRDRKDVEYLVRSTDISDLCEMYTPEEADKLGGGEWAEGRRSCGRKFVCMGFVKRKDPPPAAERRAKHPKRRRQLSDDSAGEYVVSREPWGKEGAPDDPRFSIRKEGFVHNSANDPYVAMPIIGMIDGFNSVGMQTKSTVGATYFGFGSTTLALQRQRGRGQAVRARWTYSARSWVTFRRVARPLCTFLLPMANQLTSSRCACTPYVCRDVLWYMGVLRRFFQPPVRSCCRYLSFI